MKTHELARRLLEMRDCEASLTVFDEETELFHDATVDHVSNDMCNVVCICGEVTETYSGDEEEEEGEDQ